MLKTCCHWESKKVRWWGWNEINSKNVQFALENGKSRGDNKVLYFSTVIVIYVELVCRALKIIKEKKEDKGMMDGEKHWTYFVINNNCFAWRVWMSWQSNYGMFDSDNESHWWIAVLMALLSHIDDLLRSHQYMHGDDGVLYGVYNHLFNQDILIIWGWWKWRRRWWWSWWCCCCCCCGTTTKLLCHSTTIENLIKSELE